MEYKILQNNNCYKCLTYEDNIELSICQINIIDGAWQITKWFTNENFKHQGYGKTTMKYLMKYLIEHQEYPKQIQYIWNHVNQYVFNFIHEQFDAYCVVPIAVQKYQYEDDWNSHIYALDTNKVFNYFKITTKNN